MHITKRKTLLLVLAVVAVLAVASAVAWAASTATIKVVGQPDDGSGFIGTTSVDLNFTTDAPTAAFYSLNATVVGDPYDPLNESASVAYVPGTTVAVDAYDVSPVAPASGDTVEIRVQFWKEATQTNLVIADTVQVDYRPDLPVATADVTCGGGTGVMGQQDVPWYPAPTGGDPAIATFDVNPVPMGWWFFTVDGTGDSLAATPPDDVDITDYLNRGAGDHAYDGLHSLRVHARSAAMVDGPLTDPIVFGIDSQDPTASFSGIDPDAWSTGTLHATITYSDPGGSGIDASSSDLDWDNGGTGATFTADPAGFVPVPGKPFEYTLGVTITIPDGAAGTMMLWAKPADLVGNWEWYGVEFKTDQQPPSTTYTADPAASVTDVTTGGTWTNQNVALTFDAIDAGDPASGVDYIEVIKNPASAPTLSSTGTHVADGDTVTIDETAATGFYPVYYRAVDKAGNRESYKVLYVWIDKVAPTIADDYPVGWWMNAVDWEYFTVTLTAKDANSGIAAPGLQWKAPTWADWYGGSVDYPYADWSPGSGSPATLWFWMEDLAHQGDGIFTLSYKASDIAGNVSAQDATLKVDTRAPQSDGAEGWIKGGAPYVITATDQAAGSGIAVTYYRVDNATKWTATSEGPADPAADAPATLETPVAISGANGSTHTVDFFSVDNSAWQGWDPDVDRPFPGNPECAPTWGWMDGWFITGANDYQTRTVKIDAAAPTTTVQGADADWHKTAVSLAFAATDPESGVDYTEWSLDGTTWTKGATATISKNGANTVSYRSVDKVGNVEAAQTVTVKVASKAPTCKAYNAKVKVGKTRVATLKYKVTAITPKADVKIMLKNSRGAFVRSYFLGSKSTNTLNSFKVKTRLGVGQYRIVVTAVDEAGNRSTQVAKGVGRLTVTK
ncbi:MAG TPA: hypothetical protein PLB30_06585 [Thermoleophilia bacterium]|nr:hypothetical protein [Thermoleophilia bacterium]